MRQINLENDIKPLSEFRARAADFVKHVKNTKRPLVLTQHGKSSAVLMDVVAYQSLIDKLELLQEIQVAEKQIVQGKSKSHDEVIENLQAKFK